MRTEYTVRFTDSKGKRQFNTFASEARAIENYEKYRQWYEDRGYTVEVFKTHWVGNSFHDATQIR